MALRARMPAVRDASRAVGNSSSTRSRMDSGGGGAFTGEDAPLPIAIVRDLVVFHRADLVRDTGEDAAEVAQRLADLAGLLELMRSSRMVRSCGPVRFFSTDIAWRTSPRASK